MLATLLLPALTGCAARTPIKAPSVVESPLPEVEWRPYRIQIDDQLDIKFWGNNELDQQVTVRPDGMISMPYVDDVRAAGLTPSELDAELTRRYSEELTLPELTVIVTQAGGLRVYLGGEVGNRGSLRLVENMTLLQAIQEAGGFLTTSRRQQVLLIRTQPGGERLARSVDMRPVISGENPSADVALRPDDIVFVPRTRIANVSLFVDQYLSSVLPFQALTTAAIFQSDLFEDNNNGSNDTADPPPDPDPPATDGGQGGS
ncbi:MAG: polysaccharide biosynthesis/export family protein [Acidobacteriota bacterium]